MTNHRKSYDGCLVSVVIATWNRRHDLRETLVQYSQQTYRHTELIVVDNHSTDGTIAMMRTEFPSVRLITLQENTGVKAYNIGMRTALGELIVVSDNDSYLEARGIEKMVQKFSTGDQRLAVVACEVIYLPDNVVYNWYQNQIDRKNVRPDGYPTHLFIGAGAAIKSAVLAEVGYYPEEYFLFMNEVDLSTRIIAAGYEVRYFPDIVTYHRSSPTSRIRELTYLLSFRNIIWYYWKYFPLRIAIGRSLMRIPVEILFLILRRTNPIKIFTTCTQLFVGLRQIVKTRQPIPACFVKRALGNQSEISTVYHYVREILTRWGARRVVARQGRFERG